MNWRIRLATWLLKSAAVKTKGCAEVLIFVDSSTFNLDDIPMLESGSPDSVPCTFFPLKLYGHKNRKRFGDRRTASKAQIMKRICMGCGVEFETDREDKLYHSEPCRKAKWFKQNYVNVNDLASQGARALNKLLQQIHDQETAFGKRTACSHSAMGEKVKCPEDSKSITKQRYSALAASAGSRVVVSSPRKSK